MAEREEKSLARMYGEDDLSQAPIFQGGFINFGYWKSLEEMTAHSRIQSSIALYEKVIERLAIEPGQRVIEVGCGRGYGCRMIADKFSPALIAGLDVTPDQIARARSLHSASPAILFTEGAAESIPFPDKSFDKLYSVEAAQHFISLPKFVEEAGRVLKPGGRLSLTTFFAPEAKNIPLVADLIPTVRDQIDRVTSIQTLLDSLKRVGFTHIQCESIGENVWEGFDRWTAQTELKEGWGRRWLQAYRQGLLDYYLVSATR